MARRQGAARRWRGGGYSENACYSERAFSFFFSPSFQEISYGQENRQKRFGQHRQGRQKSKRRACREYRHFGNLTTHNFHWNVTGTLFNSLHDMFMAQYTELWNAVDPIAERIRSLGHVAPGSYAQFGKLASLKDAPAHPPKALEMVRILVEGHEGVARTARDLFPLADKAGDEPTADLLTQRLTLHEQTAWMLRSLLEEQ